MNLCVAELFMKLVLNASSIKFIKDSQELKIKIDELESSIEQLKPYSERGKKFYGMQFTKIEIPVFNKIEQEYIQYKEKGIK